jgi:16S rRNA processing protein RimM
MSINEYYPIGRIVRPHGLKGEVTLTLDPHAPEDPGSLAVVYLDQNGHAVPYFVDAVSLKGSKAYVKFQDIDDHQAAAMISNHSVYLPKAQRPSPKPGAFYKDEVVGYKVVEDRAGELGSISDVVQSGQQMLVVVNRGAKEVLIPVNGPFIRKIDRKRNVMLVKLPEGFLDL